MTDMIPDQTPRVPTPKPVKVPKLSIHGNPLGRPRKNAIADTLADVLIFMDRLLEQEQPSNAKVKLLTAKLDYFTLQQKREDDRKASKIELERLKISNTLLAIELKQAREENDRLKKGSL